MRYGRSCGVLLHVTSLPSRFGIGDLGPEARRFLRWLASSGQKVWQILPLNPTTRGGSPYTALSAFAGNPWMISLQQLVEDGLLEQGDLPDESPDGRVDFDRVADQSTRILRLAWERVRADGETERAVEAWRQSERAAGWLEDWVLFATIRDLHGDRSWIEWPEALKQREQSAIDRIRSEQADLLAYHRFVQWIFYQQWDALHEYARGVDVSIFGDTPIYVSWDSADVWAHPDRFLLDEHLEPTVVAGVPPDYFSETGQRWGNPIYNWKRMRDAGYEWWISRLRSNLDTVDVLRLDHFRAFAGYWEIPASEETAVNGRWVKGPGIELFRRAEAELGPMQLVAEDLGTITPDVERLLEQTGYPGMKVMQFGFGDPDNIHLPHMYTHNTIGYTGTHDNDTFLGWFLSTGERERKHARRYLHIREEGQLVPSAIAALFQSAADVAIVPMQDVLGLDSSARMNIPGTVEGNWTWRIAPDQLTERDARRLSSLAVDTGRTKTMAYQS